MVHEGADDRGRHPVRQTLGINAVKAYVAAIVDLITVLSKSKRLNSHPNPRGEALNNVLRARRWRTPTPAARLRGQGRGNVVRRGEDDRRRSDSVIRSVLAHNVLLRSESRLAVEFPDFFAIQPCFPIR